MEHYWGEEGEPIDDWAKPIIARGPRQEFEMEQVLPGADPEDPFSDPIGESNDRKDSGDNEGAYKILMDLCQPDLRCLDAHAHLGNFVFDWRPKEAIRHYEAGVRIGELSIDKWGGVLRTLEHLPARRVRSSQAIAHFSANGHGLSCAGRRSHTSVRRLDPVPIASTTGQDGASFSPRPGRPQRRWPHC